MSSTLIRNKSDGFLPIPGVYGGGVLVPGAALVINDTEANVLAEFGQPKAYVEFETVPAGQPGSVTPGVKSGIATLVGGTVTVSGVTLTANSVVVHSRNTPAGTTGSLSAPSASRTVGLNGTGSFVINSSSGTETSTVDWTIVG
jgi:hypothetical protein